jgi:hypothetical protein
MKDFCTANNVRAGQLTILKDGVIKFKHAYTFWNPPGSYPITRTDSIFRIASISKMFTCAAIQHLIDDGLLAEDTKVYPRLGISHAALPNQKPDKNINSITIKHLVDHAGGWNDRDLENEKPPRNPVILKNGTTFKIKNSHYDPVFEIRDRGQNLKKPGKGCPPPTKEQIAQYMYGEPLQFQPGLKATLPTKDPCRGIINEIEGLKVEKSDLQKELQHAGSSEKPGIAKQIKRIDLLIARKSNDLAACRRKNPPSKRMLCKEARVAYECYHSR